ncbi:glycosyl transferase family protein [Calothrix sp. NIES-4071]|nr:glycosyl transferase family protein [Calothrix sp. NIES-4071]BAZ63733.1 glycosyl transferase family protein [Calothrix sp. NIES-4105]
MQKLLTIAIPTYNRAEMLDKQLTWLASEIKGYESNCEITIFDNCSTDNTQQVITKWQLTLGLAVRFNYNRNKNNIGGMPNIVACMQAATGKYLWTLGDDDPIQQGTLSYIIGKLRQHPSLTLMLLNSNGREHSTNQIIVDHWFDSNSDKPSINSELEFQYYLEKNMGGVLFISAAIYHTKLLQQALQSWQNADKNLASQAYWTAYCAARGSFIVTKDIYTECTMGNGFADKDPQWFFKMQFMYIPEVYVKLIKANFSRQFCLQMLVKNLKSINGWKIFLGALKRWPLFATQGLLFYLSCVITSTWVFLWQSNSLSINQNL